MLIVEQMRYRQTDQPTNQPTDTASYRGALSHLEITGQQAFYRVMGFRGTLKGPTLCQSTHQSFSFLWEMAQIARIAFKV